MKRFFMIKLSFIHGNKSERITVFLKEVPAEDVKENQQKIIVDKKIYRLVFTNSAKTEFIIKLFNPQNSTNQNFDELAKRLSRAGAHDIECSYKSIDLLFQKTVNAAVNYRPMLEKAAAQMHEIPDNEISENQIALLLGDLFIESSPYEGSTKNHLPFWNELVREWQDPASALSQIINPHTQPTTLENVKKNLQQAQDIYQLLNAITDNIDSVTKIKNSSVKKILSKIDEELKSSGRCYFPIHYRGVGYNDSGHAFTCLLERKKLDSGEELILCHLLNKGDGIENHSKITIKNKKIYIDYKFTVALNVDPFEEKNQQLGMTLLKSLLSFKIEDTTKSHGKMPFAAEEIYRLFLSIGKKIDFEKDMQAARASTPQRSGVCADMAARLIMRDSCVAAAAEGLARASADSSPPPAPEACRIEYRRMMFCARFSALLRGFASPNLASSHPLLLLRSCEGFAQTANKLYEEGIIGEEERNKSLALIELVREKAAPFAKSTSTLLSIQNDLLSQELQIKINRPDPIKKKETPPPPPSYPPVPGVPAAPGTALDLINYLQQSKKLLESYHGSDKELVERHFSYLTLAQLPIPRVDTDDFWDKIPLEEIPETLKLLDLFCTKYLTSFEKSDAGGALYGKILSTQLHAFTIIYKLASRDPDNKLEGFAPSIPLKDTSNYLLLFHEKKESDRFLEIQAFFDAMPKKGRPILKVYDEASDAKNYLEPTLRAKLPLALLHKTFTDNDFKTAIEHVQKEKPFEENQSNEDLSNELSYFYQFEEHKAKIDSLQKANNYQVLDFLKNSTPEGYKLLKKHYIASRFILLMQSCASLWEQKGDHSEGEANPKHEGMKAHSLNVHNYNITVDSDPNKYTDKIYTLNIASQDGANSDKMTSPTFWHCEDAQPWHNIGPMRDWGCRDFFKKEMKNISVNSENNILLEYGPDKHAFLHNAPYIKDFLAILSKPGLAPTNLLLWCRDNPELTAKQEVQSLIEFTFLSGNHLAAAVKNEPALIKALHSYLDQQIANNLKGTTVETALFWISLAYHIEMRCSPSSYEGCVEKLQKQLGILKKIKETQLAELTKITTAETDEKEKAETEKKIIEQQKALHLIRMHQVYLLSNGYEGSENAVGAFLSSFLEFSTCKYQGIRFNNQEEKINEALYRYQSKLPELYEKNLPQIQLAIVAFLQQRGLTEQVKGIEWHKAASSSYPWIHFTLPGPNGSAGKELWSVDLHNGKTYSQGILQQQILVDPIFRNNEIKQLLGGAFSSLLRQDDDVEGNAIYSSKDGVYTVTIDSNGSSCVERKIAESGIKSKFIFTQHGKSYSTLKRNWPEIMAQRNLWLAEEPDGQGRRYGFFTDKQSGKILDERIYLGTSKEASKQIHMEKWREADGTLILPPLRLLDPDKTACAPFFLTICPQTELFLWGAEMTALKGKGPAYVLKKVELPLRELSFTAKPDSTGVHRLFCDQQSGRYIAEGTIPAALEIAGAIPLQQENSAMPPLGGGATTMRLLLPSGQRTVSTQLSGEPSRPQKYEGSFAKKKYFLYEIDNETMRLIPSSSKALLQLVYALKAEGSFLEALSYVNSLPASTPLALNFFRAILELPSTTPEAIAFDLQLALIYIHNRHENPTPPLSSAEKEERQTIESAIWEKSTEKLRKHFFAKGASTSHVPAALSLTDGEEDALLNFLYEKRDLASPDTWELPDPLAIQLRLSKDKKNLPHPNESMLNFKDSNELHALQEIVYLYFGPVSPLFLSSGSFWSLLWDYKEDIVSTLKGRNKVTSKQGEMEAACCSARVPLEKDKENYEERFFFLLAKIQSALYAEPPAPPPRPEELATIDILLKNFCVSLSKDYQEESCNSFPSAIERDKRTLLIAMSQFLFLLRFATEEERKKFQEILQEPFMYTTKMDEIKNIIKNEFIKKFYTIKVKKNGQEKGSSIPLKNIMPAQPMLSERNRKIAAHGYRRVIKAETAPLQQQEVGNNADAPLQELLATWFICTTHDDERSQQAFALTALPFGERAPKLAKRLVATTAKAHAEEQKILAKLATYELPPSYTKETVCNAMKEKIVATKKRLKELRRRIESKVNWEDDCFAEFSPTLQQKAMQRRLQVAGGAAIAIDINQLMLALLDPQKLALSELNPLLSPEETAEIAEQVRLYQVESTACSQLQQAHEQMKKGEINEAAAILAKKRLYDTKDTPLLLFYEYATEQMLRPEQTELLKTIFSWQASPSHQRLLFEFQAGGGKTKVIAAILAARTLLQGGVPVFFSLPELHDIVKKDLHGVLSSAFLQQTALPRLKLGSFPTNNELKEFFDVCNRALELHHCQVMKPETYAVLFLSYIDALKQGDDPNRVDLLGKILSFYRENGIFFFDESHLTLSSLLQTIVAVGKPAKMSQAEIKLILAHYQWLTGNNIEGKAAHLADGRPVSQVLSLRKNQQAKLTPQEREEIFSLLTVFSKEYVAEIQKANNAEGTELKTLERLAGELCERVLPYTLQLVGEVDYGAGDPIEKPHNNSKPVAADFESSSTAAALTIQGALQRGVTTPHQMGQLLTHLLSQQNTPGEEEAEKLFLSWQQRAECPPEKIVKLENIDREALNDNRYLQGWINTLGNQAEVLLYFLENLALPVLQSYPEKICATAADLMAGGAASLGFSATLGSAEQYPFLTEDTFLADTSFLTHVIQANQLKKNKKIAWIAPSTPKALLTELFKDDKANSKRLQMLEGIIDLGAWDERSTAADWAVQANEFFLEKGLDDIAGSLYFANNTKGKEVLYLLRQGEKVATPLPSTNLKSELSKLGLSEKRFFKIYDASKCTGLDLSLGPNATMVLTLREGMTMATLAQAELRLRQFLKPQTPSSKGKGQRILAVAPNTLKNHIKNTLDIALKSPLDNDKELTMAEVCSWAILNLSEQCTHSIEARAYQEIAAVVRHAILQNMAKVAPEKQIALMKEHEKAFISVPACTQGGGMGKGKTKEVLENFFITFLEKSNMNHKLSKGELKRVEAIIKQTEDLLETISKQEQNTSGLAQQQQQEQQQQQQQEQQQQQQMASNRSLAPAQERNYAEKELRLTGDGLWRADKEFCSSAKDYSTMLPENFWLLDNVKKLETSKAYEKSFSYLLAVRNKNDKGGVWRFFACSLTDAEEYYRQLTVAQTSSPSDRQACLLTVDGALCQAGAGPFALNNQELKDLLESQQLAEVSLGASLLSGRITKKELPRIKNFIRKNPAAAKALWKKIESTHLNIKPHISLWMANLIEKSG